MVLRLNNSDHAHGGDDDDAVQYNVSVIVGKKSPDEEPLLQASN